ncbi:hypothetical protein CPB85DRAFT_1253928 [Mucidula mucida]|nr:hypothetical protein CPB85DRAFT_1253928 [Mucidula mucida]
MSTIVNNDGLSPRVLPGKRGEPPIVTPGNIDHIAIVQNWAAFSVNWLAARYPAKIVATDTTVISLLAPGFANCNELNNWYLTAPNAFNDMTLKDFTAAMTEHFLTDNWHVDHKDNICKVRQDDKQPFIRFSKKLISNNRCLEGTTSFMNDAQLVFIMKANMRRVTATAMNDFKQNADIKDLGSKLESGTADAAQGETLTAWMAKVDSLDRETRLGAKHMLAEIERAAALVIARERQNVPQQAPSYCAPSTTMPVAAAGGRFSSMGGRFSKQQTQTNSNNNVSFHSTAYFGSKSAFPNNNSAMTTRLPALTDDERAFSDVFGMCRTCRTPWQNHRSVNDVCDFPDAEDYEERTLEWQGNERSSAQARLGVRQAQIRIFGWE